MNERYKIGEAKFFLERMEESISDRMAFRYHLSPTPRISPPPRRQIKISSCFAERLWRSQFITGTWEEK
jgi:hypothetical protein